MPEASVDVDGHTSAGEDDVGPTAETGERLDIDAVAEAEAVELPTQQDLRACIAASLAFHALPSPLGRGGWGGLTAQGAHSKGGLLRAS